MSVPWDGEEDRRSRVVMTQVNWRPAACNQLVSLSGLLDEEDSPAFPRKRTSHPSPSPATIAAQPLVKRAPDVFEMHPRRLFGEHKLDVRHNQELNQQMLNERVESLLERFGGKLPKAPVLDDPVDMTPEILTGQANNVKEEHLVETLPTIVSEKSSEKRDFFSDDDSDFEKHIEMLERLSQTHASETSVQVSDTPESTQEPTKVLSNDTIVSSDLPIIKEVETIQSEPRVPVEEVSSSLNFACRPAVGDVVFPLSMYVTHIDASDTLAFVYGVTCSRQSVRICVSGCPSYLYLTNPGLDSYQLSQFIRVLQTSLRSSSLSILSWEINQSRSFMGSNSDTKNTQEFIKVTVSSVAAVRKLKSILSNSKEVQRIFLDSLHFNLTERIQLFETKVDSMLRFTVDSGIKVGSWISLEFSRTDEVVVSTDNEVGEPQVCIDCSISAMKHIRNLQDIPAPELLTFVFDIECCGDPSSQSDPSHPVDEVSQVAIVLTLLPSGKSMGKYLISTQNRDICPGDSTLIPVEDEKQLLETWRNILVLSDPDMISGYSICTFGLSYLLQRGSILGVVGFDCIGRIPDQSSSIRKRIGGGVGSRIIIDVPGRIVLDMHDYITSVKQLNSYTIGKVSIELLGAGMSSDSCPEHCRVVVELIKTMETIHKLRELEDDTGLGTQALLYRGKQYKLFAKLLRESHDNGYLLPDEGVLQINRTK